MPAAEQCVADVRSDEPGSAGDQRMWHGPSNIWRLISANADSASSDVTTVPFG